MTWWRSTRRIWYIVAEPVDLLEQLLVVAMTAVKTKAT